MLRKGINFIVFTMWIKILGLLIRMTDFSFQICEIRPTDVSRRQQPGFWAYLQYCKCCIDCFVTQLLNEPDKLCSLFKVLDRRTVSSAFSGHTWPNLTQIQTCYKFNVSVLMSDTCLNIIGLRVKQKHYLSDFNWLLVVVNIWQAVSCLLLRRQRFITIFKVKERI